MLFVAAFKSVEADLGATDPQFFVPPLSIDSVLNQSKQFSIGQK